MFLPGGNSSIYEITPGNFGSIIVQRGARTTWGLGHQRFSISGDVVNLSGSIGVAENSTVEIRVGDHLVINGGRFKIKTEEDNRVDPFIVFTGAPGSFVKIIDPLGIDLDASPRSLSLDRILLAQATPNIANPNIFKAQNHVGLIWSDVVFDAGINSWYLTNFQMSKSYYGYSSARSASSWLRQKHISIIQNRSVQALLDSCDGFWTDVHGGYEKIDVTAGDSKMPWFIFNIGYDERYQCNKNWSVLFGGSLGFDFGHNKWTLFNKVKNTITTGAIEGYVGLGSELGLYSVGTVQLSVGKVRSENTGFLTTNSWTEIVPTESIELGWRCKLNDIFSITPRAQVILEQISKRTFSFYYLSDHEKITLTGSTAVTTVSGVVVACNTKLFNVSGSVDWIKGISGDYGVHSKFFDKNFNEKNDNDVVRVSLGCTIPINEHMNISANIFGDMLDNKGIGAQARFSYMF